MAMPLPSVVEWMCVWGVAGGQCAITKHGTQTLSKLQMQKWHAGNWSTERKVGTILPKFMCYSNNNNLNTGATNQAIDETAITSVGTTDLGLRQSSCTGTELRLIDCPLTGGNGQCATRAFLTCQLGKLENW